jgi:hypothetical protein
MSKKTLKEEILDSCIQLEDGTARTIILNVMEDYAEKYHAKKVADNRQELLFNAEDIDAAYLIGIFKSSGMNGLYERLKELKDFGVPPSVFLKVLKDSEK